MLQRDTYIYCDVCGVVWIPDRWFHSSPDTIVMTDTGKQLHICFACRLLRTEEVDKLRKDTLDDNG